jgi:hypothetical protein
MDLVAKDLPILETKELTKRVRKVMIQNGTIEPTEQEAEDLGLNQPQQPDPQQQAVTDNINMQTEDLISKIEERDAKTLKAQVESQQVTIESYQKLIDTYKTQAEAGIPLSQDEHNIRVKQQDIIKEGQQVLDEGPNSEQATDIVNQAIAAEQAADRSNIQ